MPRPPKNRALVVGISNYPKGINNLPAVANDVREIAKVLGSKNGRFRKDDIRTLANRKAKQKEVLVDLKWAFRAAASATVFVYLAGHGAVVDGRYYFLPHDAQIDDLPSTAIPLETIRSLFEKTPSTQAFLWLDFCHSGGILSRENSDNAQTAKSNLVERTLRVVKGKGKVIIAACTEEQRAYEDNNHGLFTHALLSGLRGDAKTDGEVTVSSLFDFIDRRMGSTRQRPMLFGKMTGRVVLMHYDDELPLVKPVKQKVTANHTRKNKKKKPGVIVGTSGKWTLLGDNIFFEAQTVSRNTDGTITVEVQSSNPIIDVAIKSLVPQKFQRTNSLWFAHQNDSSEVQVQSIASESKGHGQLWKISLQSVEQQDYRIADDMSFYDGTHTRSANDIAVLKARQILLNEQIAQRDADVKSTFFLSGLNNQDIICPIREVYQSYSSKRTVWPKLARLKAIAVLKKTRTVDHILKLSIQPQERGTAKIIFKGQRQKQFSDKQPYLISFSGICSLK